MKKLLAVILGMCVMFILNCSNNSNLDKAQQFYQIGNFSKAEEFCNKVINEEPKNIEAYKLLFQIYLKSKNYEKAKEMVSVINKLPGSSEVYFSLFEEHNQILGNEIINKVKSNIIDVRYFDFRDSLQLFKTYSKQIKFIGKLFENANDETIIRLSNILKNISINVLKLNGYDPEIIVKDILSYDSHDSSLVLKDLPLLYVPLGMFGKNTEKQILLKGLNSKRKHERLMASIGLLFMGDETQIKYIKNNYKKSKFIEKIEEFLED